MHRISAALWAVILGGALCPAVLLAQQPDDRPTYRGLFGDRRLGQPLQPAPSTFGGGIQRGRSGDFLGMGRADGSAMFPTPWRRIEPGPLPVDWGTPPQPVIVAPQQPVIVAPQQPPALPLQPLPPQPSAPVQPSPDIWFRSSALSTGASPLAASGNAGPSYVPRLALGWSTVGSGEIAPVEAPPPFQPSPALSARITRLAQAGGVPSSAGVQVSVQGDTAIVRGAVADSYQRSLVGNLVGLEPGVWRVDNQMIVAKPGLAAADAAR
jgi:hypothetical protein